jgi:hypothetical protein
LVLGLHVPFLRESSLECEFEDILSMKAMGG